jgi:hypothetical protein
MASDDDSVNRRAKRQITATDAQVDKFTLSIDKFLNDSLDDILDGLSEGKKSSIEAASTLGSMLNGLKKKGLNKEVARIREIYAEELRYINDEFAEQGIKKALTAVDKKSIDALIGIQVSKTTNQIERYGIDIQSQVMSQVIFGKKPDIKKIQKELSPKLAANLKTEITTAVSSFNRSVTFAKAEDLGIDSFRYTGPNDNKTRVFCKGLLKRRPAIYTRSEILALDNGQGLPVSTHGGGFNCRHTWVPVASKERIGIGD